MDRDEIPPANGLLEPQETGATEPAKAAHVSGAAVSSVDESDGCDALGRAIAATLGGVMREFDYRAESAARSQDELAASIDRLTGELDKLLENAPLPLIVQQATKISSIRKRVTALNFMLKSIQRRIDNIDRMLSTGKPLDNVAPQIGPTSSKTL